MSVDYTNLNNLSLGANGADVATFTSSAINVANNISSGYLATKVGSAAAAATITALASSKSFYRMNSTIAVSLRGITAGVDGQHLDLYFKAGTHALTVVPQATAATTAARIVIMTTAASVVTTGSGFLQFIYSSDDSRWLLKSVST